MKGRIVPQQAFTADDRRLRACLKACEHLPTEALDAGLVRDALEAFTGIHVAFGLAAEVAAQGKNPAHYVDLAGFGRQYAPIARRLEASGFSEAQNRAWEARHGQRIDGQEDSALVPLGNKQLERNKRRY